MLSRRIQEFKLQTRRLFLKISRHFLPSAMMAMIMLTGLTFARAIDESSPASDYRHADIFIQVATTIVFAITLIMMIVNWLYYQYTKNLKEDTTKELLSVQKTTSTLLENVSTQIQKHQEAIQREAEATSDLCKQLRIDYQSMVESERIKILNIVNAFTERYMELFTDRVTLKQLEVIRSRTFCEIGDEKEKIRSIRIIGFMGNSDDIFFLAKIVQDITQTPEVRLAAQQAIHMIEKRHGGGGLAGPAQPTTPPTQPTP